MVYPVSQHIGAPAKPVVAVGDTVLKGQMIAEAGGFVSSPIYSSVSGKVKAIEKRRVAVGDMVDSIVIENDGMFTETTYESVEDVTALSKEEIIEKVKNAGVVGMGGAGFPTHVKLSPKEPDKIEYIIANCAECEPYLTSDYRRMLENPEELIGGMKIILQLFDNAKGILGIEDNKPDCIEKLTELTKDEPRIEVCPLMTKYPQGGERQLIYATTGRAINSKMLPADAGCIVDNVETIIAVYNAVKNGQPVLKRISTVTGDAVKNPSNILYSIGTSYQELVDAAGGFKSQPEEDYIRRSYDGFAMFSLDIPTTRLLHQYCASHMMRWQHLSHRPALTAVVAWRHVLSSSFQAVLRSLVCVDRWMSLRSGTDLSVLSVEAVHLHVRQGDRWLSLLRQ